MIRSKSDYLQYLEADRRALGKTAMTLRDRLVEFVAPDYIWRFQRLLRKLEYHKNVASRGPVSRLWRVYLRIRFIRLSLKLGFSIPENVFGPGLAIVHYGTIVVNGHARVGANCRLHASTNIGASGGTDKAPRIGDNVYVAPGAKIFGDIWIPNNTAIGANAVVNRSFEEENTLLAGVPAKRIKTIVITDLIPHVRSS